MTALEKSNEASPPTKQALPAETPDGKAALDALWAKKWAAARRSTRNTRIFGLTCFLSAPVLLYLFQPHMWPFVLFIGIVLVGTVARADGLTEDEYYSIPGARQGKRNHTCLYCGSHDKEVHVDSRSGAKSTYCADCRERLF